MKYYIGIDVSTTSTKSLLMDQHGKVILTAAKDYPLDTPRPLWSEQEPGLWWMAAIASIRQVLEQSGIHGHSIEAIGLTGQMHSLVVLDESGEVLRPAILWNDQRTEKECHEIRSRIGRERLIEVTGNDALTGFTAPKILWVRNHEPAIYSQIRHILLPKDYIRYKLTDCFAIDRADGAGTLLFDIKQRDWSPEVLNALEIDPAWLPVSHEGTQITGRVSEAAAALTGLAAGTPVVAGGGDQAAQAVGVGAVGPGIVAVTLGTSGVVFASTDQPLIEPGARLHAFCHSVPGKWHLMGVMLSAAGSLRWFRDTFAPGMHYEALTAQANDVPPGCEGLLFLPYLTGERTPYSDPNARAAFVGLTVRHGLKHMARAVLEGVAFGLRDNFELMRQAGLAPIQQVRISGGGARSALWRQILADIFQVELVTVNTTEGAAYGAALLAAVGDGTFADVKSACSATIQLTGSTAPRSNAYEESYRLYRQLYPALHPTFDALAGSLGSD